MSIAVGYSAAVADLSRSGHDDLASELLENSGFCLSDLIRLGAEEYDLEEIRKLPWPNKFDGKKET